MQRSSPMAYNQRVHLTSRVRMTGYMKQYFKKKKKPKKFQRFRRQKVKTKYSDQFKAEVIFSRFGSYTEVDKIYLSRGQISRKFHVKIATIHSWCQKHRSDPGCLWDMNRFKGKSPRKFSKLQQHAITSKDALFRQRFMTL